MEIPPINSLTKEFVFIKTYIPPIYTNLVNKSVDEKSIENTTKSTKDTIIWIKSKENKFFAQVLKNQLEFVRDKDKNAKGASKINTLIITYLKEYEKTKFNKDKVRVPLINP